MSINANYDGPGNRGDEHDALPVSGSEFERSSIEPLKDFVLRPVLHTETLKLLQSIDLDPEYNPKNGLYISAKSEGLKNKAESPSQYYNRARKLAEGKETSLETKSIQDVGGLFRRSEEEKDSSVIFQFAHVLGSGLADSYADYAFPFNSEVKLTPAEKTQLTSLIDYWLSKTKLGWKVIAKFMSLTSQSRSIVVGDLFTQDELLAFVEKLSTLKVRDVPLAADDFKQFGAVSTGVVYSTLRRPGFIVANLKRRKANILSSVQKKLQQPQGGKIRDWSFDEIGSATLQANGANHLIDGSDSRAFIEVRDSVREGYLQLQKIRAALEFNPEGYWEQNNKNPSVKALAAINNSLNRAFSTIRTDRNLVAGELTSLYKKDISKTGVDTYVVSEW